MMSKVDVWLEGLKAVEGVFLVSSDRRYETLESDYDARYGFEGLDFSAGHLAMERAKAIGLASNCAVLEIACGTGRLSLGLVTHPLVGRLLISDASKTFISITKQRIQSFDHEIAPEYLLLRDDDFDKIPDDTFDLILLRSALHHFEAFRETAKTLVDKLRPNGILAMLEPRADTFIYSALILRNVRAKLQCQQHSDKFDSVTRNAAEALADMFERTTKFYLDREADKAGAEDKHCFFLEELSEIACDLKARFHILGSEHCSSFSSNFKSYMHYCMGGDLRVVEAICEIAMDELSLMDVLLASRPLNGFADWFYFQKA